MSRVTSFSLPLSRTPLSQPTPHRARTSPPSPLSHALTFPRERGATAPAGFDAWQNDPLGGINVTEPGFRSWGERLRELARDVCEGRLLAVLEGGYDLRSLPRLVETCLEGLAGGRP